MDWEPIARWGWGLASSALGWWLHVLWTRHHEMAKQISALAIKQEQDKSEILLNTEREYTRKTDLAPLLREIRDLMERIENNQNERIARLEERVYSK